MIILAGEFAGHWIRGAITLEVTHDGEHLCLQNSSLGLYACGETLSEAMRMPGDKFEVLVEEYAQSSEPMSEKARELGKKVRELVIP